MIRFFVEVAYLGTNYAGFQIQQNACTIQGELEHALATIFRAHLPLTGSSRTDSGVHARQNFFHLDLPDNFKGVETKALPDYIYNINAVLPADISVKTIRMVRPDAHSRFSATQRCYRYAINTKKQPFLQTTSYFFPYRVNLDLMQEAAAMLLTQTNFRAFSKKHTQVLNFNCAVTHSRWVISDDDSSLYYEVCANRFLRGMVKAITGTMLRVGTGVLHLDEFASIFHDGQHQLVDFSPPGRGLTLMEVKYPAGLFL